MTGACTRCGIGLADGVGIRLSVGDLYLCVPCWHAVNSSEDAPLEPIKPRRKRERKGGSKP